MLRVVWEAGRIKVGSVAGVSEMRTQTTSYRLDRDAGMRANDDSPFVSSDNIFLFSLRKVMRCEIVVAVVKDGSEVDVVVR